jgi:hypothetical protein
LLLNLVNYEFLAIFAEVMLYAELMCKVSQVIAFEDFDIADEIADI